MTAETRAQHPVDVLAQWANDTTCSLDEANRRAATYAAVAELIEECERLCKAADGMKRSAEGMSRKSPVAVTLRIAAENILSLRPLLANVDSWSRNHDR